MLRLLVIITFAALLTGCAYSIKETMIRDSLPETYQQWNGGIRTNLTQEEIKSAVEFGQTSKENPHALMYAYLFKPENMAFNPKFVTSWYVRVRTPLYLISEHALQQARDYRKVDDTYLDYCKTLNYVAVDVWSENVWSQKVDSSSLYSYGNVYGRGYEMILLRNGERIEPIQSIPGYQGINPFLSQAQKANIAIAMKQRQAALANVPTKHRIALEKQMDLNMVDLSNLKNVYRVDDLLRDGEYSIVLRTPKVNNILSGGDEEKRFAVNFRKFR